jgi:ribonucleotide reductase beta subunit family protein with ferritin-like domain
MSAHTADAGVAVQVRQHAIDEARHARIYAAMLDTIFPGAADDDLRRELQELAPRYKLNEAPPSVAAAEEWMTLDELVQMNIGEIRTRIHQLMLMPMAAAHASEEAGPRLQRMLETIVRDETRHIAYTAVLLEAASQRGQEKLVRRLMNDRLREFCSLTLTEAAAASFEGS